MPITTNYPGVYIEEVPSGVRTITGVATSIAAFVGWAPQGPTDAATQVLSWPDFARTFGGYDTRSLLGYSVSHFFANGGQEAYIVRIVDKTAVKAVLKLNADVTVTALSPGKWANTYAIGIKARSDDNTRFRLQVLLVKPDKSEVPVESFENLSVLPSDPRFAQSVVNNGSSLISITVANTATKPPADTNLPSPSLGRDTSGDDGTVLNPDDAKFNAALTGATALLDRVSLFNLLCVPGETDPTTVQSLQVYCKGRRAFLISEPPQGSKVTDLQTPDSKLTGDSATNGAIYYPWLQAPDPAMQNALREVPPCGFMAGIYARTDASRGVWKAPAGIDATLAGAADIDLTLTDGENGTLNPVGVNCIRNFPVYGIVAWGARTLQGNDERGSEWKYIPVRRTALFIEESLFRGTKWVVFEPNDEPLWAQIRLNVGAFMHSLFRQGAFQGKTPQQAYFVKCDGETTTQDDINRGIVNILVGFAPLRPAEFVVIHIQQMAGELQT